eukprot:1161061-Pelagomonas_calceolata.AAC.6
MLTSLANAMPNEPPKQSSWGPCGAFQPRQSQRSYEDTVYEDLVGDFRSLNLGPRCLSWPAGHCCFDLPTASLPWPNTVQYLILDLQRLPLHLVPYLPILSSHTLHPWPSAAGNLSLTSLSLCAQLFSHAILTSSSRLDSSFPRFTLTLWPNSRHTAAPVKSGWVGPVRKRRGCANEKQAVCMAESN